MDPITATQLVQHRTLYLQRIAEQVRRERSLRSAPPAEVTASSGRTAEARRAPDPAPALAPAKAGGCAPAEPAF